MNQSLKSIIVCAALFTICGCNSQAQNAEEAKITELKVDLLLAQEEIRELKAQVKRAEREENHTKQYVLAVVDELNERKARDLVIMTNLALSLQQRKDMQELRSMVGQQMNMQMQTMMQIQPTPAPQVESTCEWEKWATLTRGTLLGLGLLGQPGTPVCH